MAITKRQMLFVPEVNPTSFVFFFEKGSSGMSWSIRDYSIANRVRTNRPRDLNQTADYFLQKARYACNAPAHNTNDRSFWHKHTLELNDKYGLAVAAAPPNEVLAKAATQSGDSYPVLALDEVMSLPKGRKAQDMERILHPAASEDWVTWKFFQILLKRGPADWWNWIVQTARQRKA